VRDSYSSVSIALFREKGQKNEIKCAASSTVTKAGLKNGDMLYLAKVDDMDLDDMCGVPSTSKGIKATQAFREKESSAGDSQKTPSLARSFFNLKEDQVDVELWKSSGLIERPKNPILCKHGSNGKCVNCVPLEPYDEGYLKEHKINHMSFHSHLRKMTTGIDKCVLLSLVCSALSYSF
jgi:nuclear protein localization family protein 4